MGMQELVRDVGENGGAARGDAALGHQDEEAGEEFAEVLGGGEMRVGREEVCGEVGGVTGGRREGSLQMEMIRTKTGLGLQAWSTAALSVGEAMQAARASGRRAGGCAGAFGLRTYSLCVQDFHIGDLGGHGFLSFLAVARRGDTPPAFL